MKILVACEYSGALRRAFRNKGHDAWSCDLLPSDDKSEHHLRTDVLTVLQGQWDMLLAFPPCTDLCVSGARWFPEKRASGAQQKSVDFLCGLLCHLSS